MKHAGKFPSPSRGASSSPPAHHRLSRAIAKTPPKIRIVHLLAPEVITTEAQHFRELVQRLTGMPSQKGSCASSASTGGDASPSPSPSPSPPTSVIPSCARRLKFEAESPSPSPSPSSGEGGGFLRALEMDGYNDGLYLGLEDFLFDPSCDMDAAVAGFSF